MAHQLPDLPYALDALEPFISSETLKYHHGKHHQAYVTNLNNLISDGNYENLSLERIIKTAPVSEAIYNNAAQVWNHTFYFNCMAQNAGGEPSGTLEAIIANTFGSFAQFKDAFSSSAVTNFGSGWTWLTQSKDGSIEIINTGNAGCPLADDKQPILTIDVWEHAYYIDKRNVRAEYVNDFWKLVNWDFVTSCCR